MPDLIAESSEASAWMKEALAAQDEPAVFGRHASSVIWTNATDDSGALLVPVDPFQLAAKINADPFPLLLGHDPGRPLGKVIRAKVFQNPTGETFVAAALGFYANSLMPGFSELGLDPSMDRPPPETLPALPTNLRLALAVDPREVDQALIEEITAGAPVPIDVQERSHNAADAAHTFITVSVLFAALIWNPFVTTFAQEASKDSYAALRNWLKRLSANLANRRDPMVEVQTFQGDCCVSFMFRGNDVALQYEAHENLAAAAARAASLVTQMRKAGLGPMRLVYEFHATQRVWYPSFAELSDGRLVSDNAKLIAIEQLPSGLSLGLLPAGLSEPDVQ